MCWLRSRSTGCSWVTHFLFHHSNMSTAKEKALPEENNDSSDSGEDAKRSKKVLEKLKIEYVKSRTQKLKDEILEGLDTQLEDLLDEFCQEIDTADSHRSQHTNGDIRRGSNRRELPDKVFISRKSVLTELFEISHIQTLKNIFVAVLCLFSINTIITDFLEKGGRSNGGILEAWKKHGLSLVVDLELVYWAFGKLPFTLQIWGTMQLTTILVYPALYYWASVRKLGKCGLFDWVCLTIYIIYQVVFFVYPVSIMLNDPLPPASAFIIVTEQTRLMMKSHAFVRENIPRALAFKPHAEKGNDPCPDFGCYLYFLFAPTLVYRDSYPRTKTVRWKYVVSNFAQVGGCALYIYYLLYRFCVPIFHNFNSDHVTVKRIVGSIFGCTLPGALILFLGFFALLHSWMNAFAEMLRFGDRLFYKDWWNSTHFSNYYRTWNVVVHDWLYTYIYKDVYRASNNQRTVAMTAVFFMSAVFHEYILMMGFGFFYPVLFLMFGGAGFGLMFVPKSSQDSRILNVGMWIGLFLGMGIQLCLYSMEWFARRNCPVTTNSFLDYVIPRSWTCDIVL